MKTGASRGMLWSAAGESRPAPVWCFEPVCECGPGRCHGTTKWSLCREVESPRRIVHFLLLRVHRSAAEEVNMEVVYRRCCGLDVHKDSVTACVLVLGEQGKREVRKKEFPTFWKGLQNLKLWLYACKVERVAMESTGVYWKPVWNVLEGHFS